MRAYTRLAGYSAMPHHQIDRTIGQSLWLRNKTLDTIKSRIIKCKKYTIRNKLHKLIKEIINTRYWTEKDVRTCGWFLRQDLRSSARRPRAIPPDIALSSSHTPLALCNLFSFFLLAAEFLRGHREDKTGLSSTVPILPRVRLSAAGNFEQCMAQISSRVVRRSK